MPRHAVRVTYGGVTGRPCALAGATMGTTWSARLSLPATLSAEGVQAAIQAALDQVVAQMSNWASDSDLTRYNRAARGWQELPASLCEVLDYGLWLAEASGGAYDPTVGALVRAWGFGPHACAHEPPGAGMIDAALARRGWWRVKRDGARAWQPGGIELDLCGIAKGHGVDRAAQALDVLGVADYLLEVGGELRARGRRPDGQPWRVAVALPDGGHATHVVLEGGAIATSGDYYRYFEHAGRRYAHTLDPRTGHPLAGGPASVSVLHACCMQADALATALMVLGLEAGLAFARQHGVAALFVVPAEQGWHLHVTPSFGALSADSVRCEGR